MSKEPPRNFGLDLVRVTEAAALAAGRWLGRGLPDEADEAASEAMFEALNTLDMDGRIIVGEESKLGRHSSLDTDRNVGTGYGPKMDLIVDPIDGARLLMHGRSGAISVVGVSGANTMWRPQQGIYMEKLIVDREVGNNLVPECLDAPAAWTLALIGRIKQKPIRDLVVFILERERHEDLVEEIRSAGARVWMRGDGDIAGAFIAASPHTDVDAMMGIGGISEGVAAACAVRALGGAMLGRLSPQSDEERTALRTANINTDDILTEEDLVDGEDILFAATGITDGPLLKGVRYQGERAETHSLILRGVTGTHRIIHADHLMKRLFI